MMTPEEQPPSEEVREERQLLKVVDCLGAAERTMKLIQMNQFLQ